MDRSNFYFEQEVTQAEMDQAFDDCENAIKALAVEASLTGALSGLLVQAQGTPDFTVHVTGGGALDDQGRRLYLAPAGDDIDLTSEVPATPGDSVFVRIFAEFHRVESDPRVDGAAVPLNYRAADSLTLSYVAGTPAPSPSRPALVAGKVCLATVLLYQGMASITNSDIDMTWVDAIPFTDRGREQGGAVPMGRGLDTPNGILFDSNNGNVIRLGPSSFIVPGSVGGSQIGSNRVRMSQSVETTRPAPASRQGFLYIDQGDPWDQRTLMKWASINPDIMRSHVSNSFEKDSANPPTQWELQPLTDGGGTLWPFNLFLPSTFDYSGHRWYGNLVVPAFGSNWIAPLHIPLVGLPDRSRLRRVEVDFAFPDGIGTGDFLGVYCLIHKQKWGKTAYTAGKDDVIYLGPATVERNGWGGTGDPGIVADGRVRVVGTVDGTGEIVDNEEWSYFALCFIGGSNPGGSPLDMDLWIGSAHAMYEILEASNVYSSVPDTDM